MNRNLSVLSPILFFALRVSSQWGIPDEKLRYDAKNGNDTQRVNALLNLGINKTELEKYDSAIYFLQEARRVSQQVAYHYGEYLSYWNLGFCYQNKSKQDSALEQYFTALRLIDKYSLTEPKEDIYKNIGDVYYKINKPREALDYLYKNRELAIKRKDTVAIISANIRISSVYDDFSINDSSYEILKKNLSYSYLCSDTGYYLQDLQRAMMNNLGKLLFQKKKYAEAIDTLKKTIRLYEKYNVVLQPYPVLNLGRVYFETKEYDSAYLYAGKGLLLAKEQQRIGHQSNFYELLFKIDSARQNYLSAIQWLNKFKETEDILHNEANARHLAEVQEKFETEKKEKTIEILNEEKKAKNSIIAISAGAAIVSLGFLFFVFRSKNLQKKLFNQTQELQKKETQNKLSVVENMALRSQMNPHFIFNSLNSISNYILKADITNANLYLTKFSLLIRDILMYTQKPLIDIVEEIKLLQLYLELEKLRFGDKLNFSITAADIILQHDISIPSMVIQPYVENAVKHGIAPAKHLNGRISVDFTVNNDRLVCTIEDNGIGIKKSAENNNGEGNTSMGNKITETRINTINSMRTQKILIETIDKKEMSFHETGTIIKLSFPLQNE